MLQSVHDNSIQDAPINVIIMYEFSQQNYIYCQKDLDIASYQNNAYLLYSQIYWNNGH